MSWQDMSGQDISQFILDLTARIGMTTVLSFYLNSKCFFYKKLG